MIKKFLMLFVVLALMTAFVTQADAARLYGRCQYGQTYYELPSWYYSIAYEVYNNAAGVSTNLAELRIDITANLRDETPGPADTVNIILTNARFNQPAGWTFVLFNTDTAPGAVNIVGVLAPGSTLDNLGFTITQDINAPASLYLGMAQCTNPTDPTTCTAFTLGAGIYVLPGLNATCTDRPEVKVAFTAPNETAGPMTFAKIYPARPITVDATRWNISAELNTDKDFKEFLGGPQVVDIYNINTCGTACSGGSCDSCYTCRAPSGDGEGSSCTNWIAGSQIAGTTPTYNVSFDLVSQSPEPAIKEVKFGPNTSPTDCQETTTDKVWRCSASNISQTCLKIKIDGTTENNPTVWNVENLSVTNISFGNIPVTNYCLTQKGGNVGAWFGGVEAIVPFVKKSATADTYIKLFNRYSKDAKLYAEVFNKDSGKVIVALKQITGKEIIPAGGAIEISASDLMALCPNCNWDFGQAVKFLIRVPSQTGCLSVYGNVGQGSTFSGVSCYNNPFDPYIEGIVVSIMGGQQRSVPLLFKSFKQGAYNQ